MLVAEALAARKATLKSISEMEDRIAKAAVTYADERPEDDAQALIVQLGLSAEAFADLSERINRTNNTVKFTFDGRTMTLMEGVVLREKLLLRARALKRVADAIDTAAGRGRYGYRRTKDDVKQEVHLTAATVRKQANAESLTVERLNIAMQQLNWTTALVD